MNKKRLKLACLLFALTFLVGAAFAATNGALVFGGTVRINNVATVQEARLEFISVNTHQAPGRTASIIEENGRKRLNFEIVRNWPPSPSPGGADVPPPPISFEIENTGSVAVELSNFDIIEGEPFYTITLFRRRADGVHVGVALPLTIAPGEVLSGTLDYWISPNYFPEEFDELVFTASMALNYHQAR